MENNNYENNNQRNHMPEEPENRNHNRNNHNNQGNNGNNSPKPSGFWTFLFIGSIFLFFIFMMFRTMMPSDVNVIEYSEFVRMIENGEVEEVMIGNDRITIVPKEEEGESANNPFLPQGTDYLYTGKVEEDETLTARLLENDIKVSGEIPDNSGEVWYFLLTTVLPIGLMVVLTIILFRKMSKSGGMGGFMNVGKNNAKVYAQKETGITFKDVAGEDEAIESLQEVVDFLHNPDRYVKIGARLPKGALLVGPPGTGKT